MSPFIAVARRRTTTAVAAAAVVAVMVVGGCGEDSDPATPATSAADSIAASVTDGASAAISAPSGVLESPTASAPPAPPVASTSIDSPDGTAISITDPAVLTEYAARGYDQGYLGKPLGPVVDLAGGGKFQTFEGGSIYLNPAERKPYTVHGAIGGFWGSTGHETGNLGYPAGEETRTNEGIEQKFDHDTLVFSDGVVTIK